MITPAGVAVPLARGNYSVGGVTYAFRSDPLTAPAALADGTRAYSITSTDVAGNTRTQTGFSVIVDNVVPVASDIQTTNASGGIHGRAETGDTVRFTYSEPIDPESIRAGWIGTSTNIVVRLIDGGCSLVLLTTVCSADSLEVYDATNLSRLALGNDEPRNRRLPRNLPGHRGAFDVWSEWRSLDDGAVGPRHHGDAGDRQRRQRYGRLRRLDGLDTLGGGI